MYEVVSQTPKEVIYTYIIIMGACFLTYPIIRVILTAAEKGAGRWK